MVLLVAILTSLLCLYRHCTLLMKGIHIESAGQFPFTEYPSLVSLTSFLLGLQRGNTGSGMKLDQVGGADPLMIVGHSGALHA